MRLVRNWRKVKSCTRVGKETRRGTEWTIGGDGPEAGGGVIRGTLWGPSAVSRQRSPLQNAFGRCVCAARSGCPVDESRCVPPRSKKLINEFRRIRVTKA